MDLFGPRPQRAHSVAKTEQARGSTHLRRRIRLAFLRAERVGLENALPDWVSIGMSGSMRHLIRAIVKSTHGAFERDGGSTHKDRFIPKHLFVAAHDVKGR